MGKISRRIRITLLASFLGLLALAIPHTDRCAAAFPGTNTKLAYAVRDGASTSIWAANSDGNFPTRLTTGGDDSEPSYSADGGRIVFKRANDVYVMSASGSEVKRVLAGDSSSVSAAKWLSNYETPKGETIPFVKVTTVTAALREFKDPALSPDGDWLAVVEDVEDTVTTTTCAVAEEESQECLASSNPDAYLGYGQECKCGSRIIEASSKDGGQATEITPVESETQFRDPTFSANGALAYARSSPSTPGSAIFAIAGTGAAPRQITNGPSDYAPDFSPNGSRIVFEHGEGDLGLVGTAGGLLTILPLSNPPGSYGGQVESPVFSPDGLRIALGRSVVLAGGTLDRGIYTIGSDGSGATRILNGGWEPSWQPGPLPAGPPENKWARAEERKKKVRLDKRHTAVIGRIICGSSKCKLRVVSSRLKVGGRACTVKTMLARKLAPGKITRVKVKVRGKCLAALEAGEVGSIRVNVKVTGQPGKQVLLLKARLWSPPRRPGSSS